MFFKLKQSVEKFKKKDFVVCSIIIVVFTMVLFYGNLKINQDKTEENIFAIGDTVMQLFENTVYEQEIYLEEETVAISFKLATYQTKIETGTINVQLLDSNKNVVYENTYDATLIEDNQDFEVVFDDIVSEGDYLVRLVLDDFENQTLGIYLSEENMYEDYNFYLNSIPDTYDIFLTCAYSGTSKDTFSGMYIVFNILLIGLVLFAYIQLFVNEVSIEKVYLLAAMILAIVYTLMLPPYTPPDEPIHFYTAYEVSNWMLGVEKAEERLIAQRVDDANVSFWTTETTRKHFNEIHENWKNFFIDNEEIVRTGHAALRRDYHLYVPSSIAISIARLLHLNTMPTVYFGRLANIFVFIWATYRAMRIIPFGKMIVFVWAILPMTLQLTSSLSYDAMLLALSITLVSEALKILYDEKNVGIIDWGLLLISTVLLIPAKLYAITPLCILTVIVLIKNYKKNDYIKKAVNGTIIFMSVYLIYKIIRIVISSLVGSAGSVETSVSNYYTLSYLLNNPIEFFEILANTVYVKMDFYIDSFLGNSLGWFEINIPDFVVWPFLFLLILAGMRRMDEEIYIDNMMRFVCIIVAVLGFGFAVGGMLLRWTPFGYGYVEGVQGRYLLPFTIPLFLVIRSKEIAVDKCVDKKICVTGLILHIFVVLCVWLWII